MKKKISCVYLIENLINCKKYIGQTINFQSRKKSHERDSKINTTPLYQSIRKHGWDNFEFTILMKDNTINHDYLDFWECYFIEIFDTINREKGYNCESGGSLNKFYCEETINKMTIANINNSQQSSAKSGIYKGVTYVKSKNHYQVALKIKGKSYQLGCSSSEIEGAKLYNQYVLYLNNIHNTNYKLNDIPDYITIARDVYTENKIKIIQNKSSKYFGVILNKKTNKFRALLVYNKKQLHLGFFENEIDAAKAYNIKANELNKQLDKIVYKINEVP